MTDLPSRVREVDEDTEIRVFIVSDQPEGMSPEDASRVTWPHWMVVHIPDGGSICTAHGDDCDHARRVTGAIQRGEV